MNGKENKEILFRRLRQALLERLEESGEQTDEEVQACIDTLIRKESIQHLLARQTLENSQANGEAEEEPEDKHDRAGNGRPEDRHEVKDRFERRGKPGINNIQANRLPYQDQGRRTRDYRRQTNRRSCERSPRQRDRRASE